MVHEWLRLVTGLSFDEEEALSWLLTVFLMHLGGGSTICAVREALVPSFRSMEAPAGLLERALLLVDEWDRDRLREDAEPLSRDTEAPVRRMGALIGGPESRCPLIWDGLVLSTFRLRVLEERLAECIRKRLSGTFESQDLDRAVSDVQAAPPRAGDREVRLTEQQVEAVQLALRSKLSFVAGGPGTGKTSIVVSMLRALVRLGVEPNKMVLSAPTGRAAERMRESVGVAMSQLHTPALQDQSLLNALPGATTLHRLLGFLPSTGGYRYGASIPLPFDVVVVDESSMIDLAMFERLVSAVHADARLVFLGDPDQLPSVGEGAAFRDLSAAVSGTRLTKSFRMNPKNRAGRAILTIASRVNSERGHACFSKGRDDAIQIECRRASQLNYSGVEMVGFDERDVATRRFFQRYFEADAIERLRESPADNECTTEALSQQKTARILCVTRGSRLGTVSINATMHALYVERFASNVYKESASRNAISSAASWQVGEPVLVTRNDYRHGLFNGDTGVVVASGRSRHDSKMVAFEKAGGIHLVPLVICQESAELGYAVTVHKSQGSEYDHVMILLPGADTALGTKEVLYTAITRARQAVTLIGDSETFVRAAERSVARASRLAALLDSAFPIDEVCSTGVQKRAPTS
ncbi:MAG: exodeoxyribonuclease V subunit alpha [Myxococcota bacterium]